MSRLPVMRIVTTCVVALLLSSSATAADWPMPHGNAEHTGRSEETLQFPLTLQWVVEFQDQRLPTAAEPAVTAGAVSVTTIFGETHRLDAITGALIDSHENSNDLISPGVTPIAFGKQQIFGDRTGSLSFSAHLPAPVRQTAAVADGRFYLTAEDLLLRCFDAKSGKLLWTSEQMSGQTARDYYPVIARVGAKKFVVVRTNPVLNMAKQIADDRNFLIQQAGVDGGDWKKLDTWIKSPAASGRPELIAREQDAVIHYLETNRSAQTFYVFDAETGTRAFTPPIMWTGGCQGVGAPPAITKEGKAVVVYRSAYGNWNHGVAPLIALGLLNFETGRIESLRHNQGAQPPWNTFWGTADEAQNFTIAGDDLIIVHQGTLARFNLKTHDLEKIWGERDTYGGFKNPAWARNEWHGPARGGVAIANGRIYWITGSRLLCLGPDKPQEAAKVRTIPRNSPSSKRARPMQNPANLASEVSKAISSDWAPLYVEPGLAGREFFFADSRELLTAYSLAFPLLKKSDQPLLRKHLSYIFNARSPVSTNSFAPLNNGKRREHFEVPPQALNRLGNDRPAHRFGGAYSAWLFAEKCDAEPQVLAAWMDFESAFDDFILRDPGFGKKPELYFNRYLASLIAFEAIAKRANHPESAARARKFIETAKPTLIAWWKEAGTTLTNFNGSAQLDPFIQKGDKLSWAVFPHRHKLAIFQDMTPEIADIIRAHSPEAAEHVWRTFTNLASTWYLQGEERQYHFGENFVDTPDFALAAFQAHAFLHKAPRAELLSRVDIPFCKADLYYIQKLAIALAAPEK